MYFGFCPVLTRQFAELLKIFFKRGSLREEKNDISENALHVAILNSYIRVSLVETLVEEGIPVNGKFPGSNHNPCRVLGLGRLGGL